MLTKENTFYRNLLLLNIAVLLLLSQGRFGNGLIQPVYLAVVLHFFVLAQFYMDRWSLRLFPLVFLLSTGFYLPSFVKELMYLFEGGPSFYLQAVTTLLTVLPAVYAAVNYKLWFGELTQKTPLEIDANQGLFEFIPLAAAAVIGVITLLFHPIFNVVYGIQSFHTIVEDKFSITAFSTNLLSKETFVFVVLLAVLYITRKNIRFGFILLSFFLFNVISYYLTHYFNITYFAFFEENQAPTFTLKGFLFEALPAIFSFIAYLMYFNRDKKVFRLFAEKRETKKVHRENRPEVTLKEFVEKNKGKLILESTILSISQVCFCIFVIIQSFSEYTVNPVMLIFAFVQLVGVTLFYFGSRGLNSLSAIFGFVITVFLPLALIAFLIENSKAAFGFGESIIIILLLNMLYMFIWGIPILGALTDEYRFVRFVQNRDFTRMFNEFPATRFPLKDLDQREVDTQSQALIPWNKRRVRSIIFLTLSALSFILTTMYLGLFERMDMNLNAMIFYLLNLVMSTMLIYTAILKWGLMLNQAIATTYLILYSCSTLISIYNILNASLVDTSQIVGLVIQLLLIAFFGEILHQLSKQRFADHRSGMLDDDIIEKEI